MRTSILRALMVVAFLTGLLGVQPRQTVNASNTAEPTPPAKGLRYGYNSVTGKVSFIGGDHSTPLVAHIGGISPQAFEDSGKAALSQYAPAFGIQHPDSDLHLAQTESGQTGHTLRYQQQYNGIPVLGGELIVNSDSRGNVLSLNGEVSPDLALANVTPAITAEQATQIALESMPGWYKLQDISSKADEPALWIYDARLLKPGDAQPELVWKMNIEATGGWHPINELVLVDAETGKIALHFNQVADVENATDAPRKVTSSKGLRSASPLAVQTSEPMQSISQSANPAPLGPSIDSSVQSLAGSLDVNAQSVTPVVRTYMTFYNSASSQPYYYWTQVCSAADATCTYNEDAAKAHRYALSFWWFRYDHGLYNNNPTYYPYTHDSVVHYPVANNAFKDIYTGYVFYGDGFISDDVTGHEFAHARDLFGAMPGFYNYYQTGAIGESFSDIMGEWFDQTNGLGNDSPSVKWLIGEDLPVGAIRSLSDPTLFGDADKMTSPNYYLGTQDNGGVHANSGIGNKAAYLMVEGGAFNGRTVTGIGWDKTAAVYIYAARHLLASGSDYNDLYNALNQACTVQVGGDKGITSGDCDQVLSALKAVEMDQPIDPAFRPQVSECPDGFIRDSNDLYYEDFENNPYNMHGGYQFGVISGPHQYAYNWNRVYIYDSADSYISSGRGNLWARSDIDDASSLHTSDTFTKTASGAIIIPYDAETYFRFEQAFDFEYGYDPYGNPYNFDGSVIEYSVNSGPWTDAEALFDGGQNYNGTLYYGTYYGFNPLRGRRAFVQESHGYVSTRYRLTNLAGNDVQFRFRLGTDATEDFRGWYLDNIRVYSCRPASGFVDDAAVNWSYSGSWSKGYSIGDSGAQSSNYRNSWHWTGTPGDKADLRFKGNKIQIVYGNLGTSGGKIDVYIDDVLSGTVDESGAPAQSVWTSSDLTDDFHSVSLRYSQENAPGKIIAVDALHIGSALTVGTYDDTDPGLSYMPGWTAPKGVSESNGTRHQTNHIGNQASILFYGTRASLQYSGYPAYRGKMKIMIDGKDAGILDEYASSYQLGILWSSDYLTPGNHILTAEYLSGQATNLYGVIDGVVIDNGTLPGPAETGFYDDLDSHAVFLGSWTSYTSAAGHYQNSYHQTANAGAVMRFQFSGTQVQLQYSGAPSRGLADIYIDNTFSDRLNQYAAAPEMGKTWGSSLLSSGTHTLELRYVSGQTLGATISVDALIVPDTTPLTAGMHEDTDPSMVFIGNWTARSGTGDRSGTRHDTNDPNGASVVIPFHGTRISILYASYPGYRGNADIYIDGVKQTVLNQYALFLLYQTPWTSEYLALGNHVLRVNFLSGQSSDKYFHIDAVAVSTASPIATVGPGTYDDMYDTNDPLNNPYIDYIGSWAYFPQATGHYNNTRHETAVNDAKVRFPFHGTQVSLVYSGYPTRGKGDIYIDNQYVTTLDQKTATWQVGLHWDSPILTAADHVLEFRYVNGQPIGANIVLDEFIVKDSSSFSYLQPGIHDDTDTGIDYSGNWTARTGTGDRNGTRHDTNDPNGATAVIPFHGTRISILYASYPGYRGNADIYIDGVKQTVLNQYALFLLYQTPWTSDYLTHGDHILEVNFLPGQDADKYFHIDAVAISDSSPLSAVGAGTYDDMSAPNAPLNTLHIDSFGSGASSPRPPGH